MSQPTNYPSYALHVEPLFPAELRQSALAAGLPWGTVLQLIGQYGLPLVIQFLQALLPHVTPPAAPKPTPQV